MNMITITITERTANHFIGTTDSGERAEYFAAADIWYIGERTIRPWEAIITLKIALVD